MQMGKRRSSPRAVLTRLAVERDHSKWWRYSRWKGSEDHWIYDLNNVSWAINFRLSAQGHMPILLIRPYHPLIKSSDIFLYRLKLERSQKDLRS